MVFSTSSKVFPAKGPQVPVLKMEQNIVLGGGTVHEFANQVAGPSPEQVAPLGPLRFPETKPDGDWQNPARTGLLATVRTTGAAEIPVCSHRRRPILGTAPSLGAGLEPSDFPGFLIICARFHLALPPGSSGSDFAIPHFDATLPFSANVPQDSPDPQPGPPGSARHSANRIHQRSRPDFRGPLDRYPTIAPQ